jgi:quercetin dioxygenase-like cupin family protein
MAEIAELLEAHVRLEERELFPLIEQVAAAELGAGLRPGDRGVVWGAASDDLNVTLLAWPPGEGPGEQVNDERDVLVFVADGSATLDVDGQERSLHTGDASIVAKGARRKLTAGPRGVRYLSVHLRRPPLQISSRPSSAP